MEQDLGLNAKLPIDRDLKLWQSGCEITAPFEY